MKDFFKALGAGALIMVIGAGVFSFMGRLTALMLSGFGVDLDFWQSVSIPLGIVMYRMLWFGEGPFGGEFWQRRGQ